jgi:hypothetical protein
MRILRKIKLLSILVAISVAVFLIILLPRILSKNSRSVRAGRPEVKASSDESYKYEFEGGSFKVYAGEQLDKPSNLYEQGSRELQLTILEGQVDAVDKVDVNPPANPIITGEGTSTSIPEVLSPTGTLTPTPIQEVQLPDGLDKMNNNIFDGFSTEVHAATNLPTSFQSDPATSSGSLEPELISSDVEQYILYQNEELKVKPQLDKVVYEKTLEEGESLPDIFASSSRYHPAQGKDGVIFQTRTNRHAYAVESAKLTDANGDSIDVTSSFSSAGQLDYLISFSVDESWLRDGKRSYPLTFTYDFVSLFHERMLAIFPSKLNYKAFEPLEFEINTVLLNDSSIQSSLLNNNLNDLKVGTIDANGKQRLLNAEITRNEDGIVTLELRPKTGEFRAGIFDLLVQYKDNSAYIAEEEFSWGVLAINPDMAVYPIGATTRLDMAVLDKYGEMVCDADLLLTVTAPDGTTSELSTLDGSIKVSDTCEILMTGEPDYMTTYRTGVEGEYQLTLSAVTDEGTFVIDDSFGVDSTSPFYVRRTGPTRIYPIEEYEMGLEVTSATNSGSFVIEESVPNDFDVNSGIGWEKGDSGLLTWKGEFTKGQKRNLSYSFDAPDVSPALFLIGPLSVKTQVENDKNKPKEEETVVFSEKRKWQIASDVLGITNTAKCGSYFSNTSSCTINLTIGAANLIVVQVATRNGSQAVNSTGVTDATDGDYTEVTSATYAGPPSVEQWYKVNPSTDQVITVTLNSADYGDAAATGYSGVDTTTPVETASSVTNSGTNSPATANITCANSGSWSTSVMAHQDSGNPTETNTFLWETYANDAGTKHTSAGEYSNSCADSSWTLTKSASWGVSSIEINQAPSGPTTDQIMRHGNWFSGGTEQYFYWAN